MCSVSFHFVMASETVELAEFIAEASYDDFPDRVIDRAKECLLDYLGVAIYGSHHEVGDKITNYVQSSLSGEDATLFGRGTASPPGAALANGTYGHAIDYDDTFESIVIHPTSPVFAAALASAEVADATGKSLLTGYLVGLEAAFRTGHSTYPNHYDNGWHSTGTVGSFGSAAAAASILGLSTEQTVNAIGIVASGSSSLKKNFGSMTKPLHSGHAAQIGVRAALLAADGFTADEAILDGNIGYGAVMTTDGSYDPSEIVDGLGETWAVMDIGFKPYPSGVITHAAMDAMRNIVVENELEPEDVERVTVSLEEAASEMLHHANPKNALQAKFSIEFCLAAILREHDAGIHEFTDEYVAQEETKAEIAKVKRDFEPDLFGGGFTGYGARVIVETRDGAEYIAEEPYAPGSPNNPLAESRVVAKFRECAEAVLDEEAVDTVQSAVMTLEEEGKVDALLNATQQTSSVNAD